MFQVSSGPGDRAVLNYDTPFKYLAPKATITFTFSYGCDNHYSVSREFDLRIPTTTISGNAVSEGFVLDANAVVTVTDTIRSNKNAKTIVPAGTRLILDGGCMIGNGDGMWQGIEVWGNSSMHQHEVNGSYVQGYIELKNGAVVENAKCAVELWRPGHNNTTGGIIHATDATFRNNAKAVHALEYAYSPNGKVHEYNAFFHNCTFTIDNGYPGTKTFHKHVELKKVVGFKFLGCSFSTDRRIDSVSPYCVGIGVYGAGFMVDSYCEHPNGGQIVIPCPEENLTHSSFSNFYRGIHASNSGSTAYTFSVTDAVFHNNNCGIYALNTDYATIVNNDFTVGCGWDCDFGIYADGVEAFCVEDNTFHPKTNNQGSPYGIAVVNSNGVNDVYHNDFSNLRCGNVAVGDNTVSGNGLSPTTHGLTYTCNTNSGNLIDFCVLKDGNIGDIANPLGSATLPAGNTFGGSLYHFYNDGVTSLSYVYDSNEPDQEPTLLYRVGTNSTQSSHSCPSHYAGGAVIKSAAEKAALASDYLSARSTYNSLLQLYNSRIDDGDTPAQVADINSATPADLWGLRARLLGLSPYVSGEVLTTAADRTDVFTDPVLFEILAANPDELRKDSLINYLENKDQPMPAYMTGLLRQMASGFTARTALLAQMGQYAHDRSLAAGDIVRSCLNDSVTDLAELRTWLGNMGDIASDRMIVASYLQEGDSTNAFALANMLPELYGLQGDALTDHEDYMRLIGLHQTLNRESRTVSELTGTELAMVEAIAEAGKGISKSMADAILMERSDEYTRDYSCPTVPESNGGNRGEGKATDASMNEALGFTASVSPNPATTWTTVEYTLPAGMSQATFAVTNTLGVTLLSTELNGRQGQKVLDLRGLADGVYVYNIRCGEFVTMGKLVITK